MKNLPKVLVVGINSWIDNTGINTLINLFGCWDKEKIAQIYTTDSLPNTAICDKFFRISENKVMKSVFKRKIVTGERVYNAEQKTGSDNRIKKRHGIILTWCREAVWKFGKWKTRALDEFIEEFKPDVLFMPLYSSIYMNRLQCYIAKKTGKPVVVYASDDNYAYRSSAKDPLSLLHRAFLRAKIRKLVNYCKQFIVIAPKQKEEYDKIFKIDSKIITKGIDYSGLEFKAYKPEYPIKAVYTGKLIIGRGESLAKIAEAMGEINRDGEKITLDIYTSDQLTEKQKLSLNVNGCAVRGAVSLKEVENIQSRADILIFVEGLGGKYKNKARLSFSTKITDYLKSGKCIFAVGDRNIAPIDYFLKNDSAIVATNKNEITERLSSVCGDLSLIEEYARKAFDCGVRNHEKSKMDALLKNCICGVIDKND